jgi:hypothetical protein
MARLTFPFNGTVASPLNNRHQKTLWPARPTTRPFLSLDVIQGAELYEVLSLIIDKTTGKRNYLKSTPLRFEQASI